MTYLTRRVGRMFFRDVVDFLTPKLPCTLVGYYLPTSDRPVGVSEVMSDGTIHTDRLHYTPEQIGGTPERAAEILAQQFACSVVLAVPTGPDRSRLVHAKYVRGGVVSKKGT